VYSGLNPVVALLGVSGMLFLRMMDGAGIKQTLVMSEQAEFF
jgi:hypothetical protein